MLTARHRAHRLKESCAQTTAARSYAVTYQYQYLESLRSSATLGVPPTPQSCEAGCLDGTWADNHDQQAIEIVHAGQAFSLHTGLIAQE